MQGYVIHQFPLPMAGLINILITTYSMGQNDTQSIKISLKNRELVTAEAIVARVHASGQTHNMRTKVVIMSHNMKKAGITCFGK